MPQNIRKEKVVFDDAVAFQLLCGSNNSRLKLIERTISVALHVRGNEITIEAPEDKIEGTKRALQALYHTALTSQVLTSDDVVRALGEPLGNTPNEFSDAGAGTQPGRSHGREDVGEAIVMTRNGRAIRAKGESQRAYVELVRKNDIVFANGPAGTGKTYLAVAVAIRALLDKSVRRIVLTRPAVEAGEKLGFLPGTLEEKVNPYIRPLMDALGDVFEPDRLTRHLTDGSIEVAPLAFMRGRTLNDSFVILDEAQNTTPEQMKMFLTRLGFGSKAVVTGDPSQTDLPRGQRSGLRDALDLVEGGDNGSGIKGIGVVQFRDTDVVRHPLVASLIRAYDSRDRARFEQSQGSGQSSGNTQRQPVDTAEATS